MPQARYFEDFIVGETIAHPTPRTISEGDSALALALYGTRNALVSSAPFARTMGYRDRPLDDVLVFNIIFGKSVHDISYHAIANLGYGEGVFCHPVYCGDTLSAQSQVLGLRENKSGKSGIVMVRTKGFNQDNICVLSYIRWVMVHKSNAAQTAHINAPLPSLAPFVSPADLQPPQADFSKIDIILSGSKKGFADYAIGTQIFHKGGTTLSEAEHMLATRLYQNTAQVHFNAQTQAASAHKARLIYGGHIIAHMRALSFDGLENALGLAAINGGAHRNPAFSGTTLYGATMIVDKATFAGRSDIGALRVRHIATQNQMPCSDDFENDKGDHILLDFDCWLWLPNF